jgi:hypothetical protein
MSLLEELIDLRKKKQVQKASVAADKQPRLKLGVVGISIGQKQSDGPTSRVTEASLGSRVEFTSYKEWKRALPKNATFHGHENETAQAFGKDFEGVAGRFIHDKNTGWIYAYYLKPENLL